MAFHRKLAQSCSLPIRQVRELDALAHKLRVSKSALMEEALEPLLRKYGAKELLETLTPAEKIVLGAENDPERPL